VTGYIIRRLFYGALLIVVLMIVLFLSLHVLGDPVTLMLPEDATQEQLEAARHQYGYDRPVLVQLADYLNRISHLDLGDSIRYHRPAGELFSERFPKTMALAGVVLALALPLGLLLGLVAGLWPFSILDRSVTVISFVAVAMPSFWLALMLIVVFAVQLGLLPTSGFGGFTNWQYYVLPVIALAFRPTGRVAQLARSALVEELAKQYVTVARAKGLSEARVLLLHTLKNAMNPVITLGAGEVVNLFGGSVVIESIFGWPGIGSLMIDSIISRDLYVVETCVIAIGVVVVFVNLVVDVLYAYFDPRVVYK
jgi:peptide/nickel transport system permease protein